MPYTIHLNLWHDVFNDNIMIRIRVKLESQWFKSFKGVHWGVLMWSFFRSFPLTFGAIQIKQIEPIINKKLLQIPNAHLSKHLGYQFWVQTYISQWYLIKKMQTGNYPQLPHETNFEVGSYFLVDDRSWMSLGASWDFNRRQGFFCCFGMLEAVGFC